MTDERQRALEIQHDRLEVESRSIAPSQRKRSKPQSKLRRLWLSFLGVWLRPKETPVDIIKELTKKGKR